MEVLYADPSAHIRVNGELSEPFELGRGTRQGFPLSPLQFALALEPLAAQIRTSPEIVGFQRGQRTDVISLYADNTLLNLGDTQGLLQAVMALIDNFEEISGFNINWNKSVLLPLDPLHCLLPECARAVEGSIQLQIPGHTRFP